MGKKIATGRVGQRQKRVERSCERGDMEMGEVWEEQKSGNRVKEE